MKEELSFNDQLRINELKQRIKIGFLAEPIYRQARKLARLLYNQGYLGDVIDKDLLTGLYNRNFYEEWIDKVASQAKRSEVDLVLVSIDVDGLKKMNDSLGHAAGDRMIKNLAKIIVGSIRWSDMVIRMGGDEFLIVFWNGKMEGIKEKMEKIVEKAGKQEIAFSYGLAVAKKGKAVKKRQMEADAEMYLMKKELGRGRE